MARKTIEINEVKSIINGMLANSAADVAECRTAVSALLEHILMDTGNYHGFHYLDVKFNDDGTIADGDETRRRYY